MRSRGAHQSTACVVPRGDTRAADNSGWSCRNRGASTQVQPTTVAAAAATEEISTHNGVAVASRGSSSGEKGFRNCGGGEAEQERWVAGERVYGGTDAQVDALGMPREPQPGVELQPVVRGLQMTVGQVVPTHFGYDTTPHV